jgi:hypothetical protein
MSIFNLSMFFRVNDKNHSDNLKTLYDDALLKNKVKKQSGALTPTESKPVYKHQ